MKRKGGSHFGKQMDKVNTPDQKKKKFEKKYQKISTTTTKMSKELTLNILTTKLNKSFPTKKSKQIQNEQPKKRSEGLKE